MFGKNQFLFFAHFKNTDYTCSKSPVRPFLHPFLHLQNIFQRPILTMFYSTKSQIAFRKSGFICCKCEKQRLYVFQIVCPPVSAPVSTPVSAPSKLFPRPILTMVNSADATLALFWRLFDSICFWEHMRKEATIRVPNGVPTHVNTRVYTRFWPSKHFPMADVHYV